MYPTLQNPYFGIFVKTQINSLEQRGLDIKLSCIGPYFGGYRKILSLKKEVQWSDIIHCHFGHLGSLALFWKFAQDKPLVVSYCGSDLLGSVRRNGRYHFKGKILALANSYLSRYVTYAIAKSGSLSKRIKTRRIKIIPSGVDMLLFKELDRESSRERIGLKDYPGKIILFLGQRNNPVKNFSLFQETLECLDFEFKYIALEAIPYEKVVYFLNSADVCVLTSFHEGSPNVIKEAMACNRPVVSVDVGDVKELFKGVEGCFVVKHDPKDIADAVSKAVQFDKVNARQRLLDLRLDLESTAEKIMNIYCDILNQD
jgi:glycosyltransferase involved in cell wall biosynthesis